MSNGTEVRVYEPPKITIASPRSGGTISGIIEISGTSSGENATVQVSIDDGTWIVANGVDQWSYRWDTRSVSDGSHKIIARVIDEHKNEAKTTIYVSVTNGGNDITIPSISIVIFVVGMSLALIVLLKRRGKRIKKRKIRSKTS